MRTFKHLLIGLISVVFVCGTVGLVTPPAEQAEAIGGGFFNFGKCAVPPTWGDIIHGKKRWVKKMGGAAYCDIQTGLVLEAEPSAANMNWADAKQYCLNLTVGDNGQKGWRLMSIPELASLVDLDSAGCAAAVDPVCLPDGNPFSNVQSGFYWSATDRPGTDSAWVVVFLDGNVSSGGYAGGRKAWCGRGPMAADAY